MKCKNSKIYLSSDQIYKIDKLTTEKFLIPSMILMENAGRLSAEFIKKFAQRKKLKNILIFCGPGKNGGDGFVIARYLHIWCFKVKVIVFETDYKNETLQNYEILKKLNVNIEKFDVKKLKKEIDKYDIIIDAIFGIGLKRNIEDSYKDAVELINDSQKPVFAIDIPTGIQSDVGKILGCCVRCSYTLSMGFLKLAFKNKEVKRFCGRIKLLDIGYPNEVIKNI